VRAHPFANQWANNIEKEVIEKKFSNKDKYSKLTMLYIKILGGKLFISIFIK